MPTGHGAVPGGLLAFLGACGGGVGSHKVECPNCGPSGLFKMLWLFLWRGENSQMMIESGVFSWRVWTAFGGAGRHEGYSSCTISMVSMSKLLRSPLDPSVAAHIYGRT